MSIEAGSFPSLIFPVPLEQAARVGIEGVSYRLEGGDGQQRVIAPRAGVAPVSSTGQAVVAGALLGQTAGLADGGVQVDDQRPVAGSGAGGPGPGQQFPAHPVQVADMTPPEAAQERPQSPPSRKRGVRAL